MPSFPTGLGYALGDDLLTQSFFDSHWTIVYVDSVNGSDATGYGSRGNPYATLAAAYAAVGTDNTIYILADNHAETIATQTITARTAVIGAGKSQGLPTATLTAASGTIFHIDTEVFVIRNVKLIGTTAGGI